MSTLYRLSTSKYTAILASTSRRTMLSLLVGSVVVMGLTGCGQKGDLYLSESSSQTIDSAESVLDSTSHPQDAAFADIGAEDYQSPSSVDLPEPSDDPNDY